VDFLTNRLGPLPAWAWGAVIGGTVLVANLLRRRGGEEEVAPETPVDSAGDPYALPASGAVLPWYDAGGAAVDAVGSGVSPELLERLAAIEDRIADQPPAPSLEEELERLARLQDVARSVVEQPNPQPPAAPAPVAPPPPPPAPPPPAPPAPVYPQPVAGTIIWSGENEPNAATIRNLLQARYGRSNIRWDARRTGPATARSGPDWVAVLL
jgi:hypothetical protein